MRSSYLVTGGTGFIGSALVRRLVQRGVRVRVLDDDSRGNVGRLDDIKGQFEFIGGDVRDPAAVSKAARGVEGICHAAFVNGTEFFYTKPELVLDVGVKGMVNVLDACREHGIGDLILASSSEVYQTPPRVPTDESAPLSIPDPLNPRYSYAAGKIISEIMSINFARKHLERMVIFRPHNVYGPNMGWEHVVPQFLLRMADLAAQHADPIPFPIQGDGSETRAFIYIDDFIDGVMLLFEKGDHQNIYHIGTMDELSIARIVELVAEQYGRKVRLVAGPPAAGGVKRRCPDTAKIEKLGFKPETSPAAGIAKTAAWYDAHRDLRPAGR
jgi:nucleoside-diphosphate-sugar epimerase